MGARRGARERGCRERGARRVRAWDRREAARQGVATVRVGGGVGRDGRSGWANQGVGEQVAGWEW
jgi:hypothetical protein